MLKTAAGDIGKLGSHFMRAAAVSSTDRAKTVSLKTTVKAAGLITDRTFSQIYKKTVSPNFGQMLLVFSQKQLNEKP